MEQNKELCQDQLTKLEGGNPIIVMASGLAVIGVIAYGAGYAYGKWFGGCGCE